MNVQRCPECGQRLSSSYCDICMRKVPFGGVKLAKRRDPWDSRDGSSAHRMERDHECISFEKEEKKPQRKPATKRSAAPPKKILQKIAVFIAVFSLVPSLVGILEEVVDSESIAVPEPAASVHDGFVAAGDPGAEEAPKVNPGEIYNENGVRVTVDDAGLSYGDYTIFFTIHNETDQKISVNADLLSVNGYMLPFGFYQDVKAGKSEQTSLSFYDYELEKVGIQQVGNVEFVLEIYDEKNYEYIEEGKLVAVETDHKADYSAMTGIAGLPLYSDEDISIILHNFAFDDYGDCELGLYAQNHSQNTVNISGQSIRINGEEVSGFIWNRLRSNTCAIDSSYIYDLDEQENLQIQSLEDIDEVTIDLYVEYLDGWDVVKSFSESVTFEPSAIHS